MVEQCVQTGFGDYARRREESSTLRDGLQRRTEKVAELLSRVECGGEGRLLDVGTADGKMLDRLRQIYPRGTFIGMEVSKSLARVARSSVLDVVVGDARLIPFPEQSFDVVLLSATLKHVLQYRRVLAESRRVLVPTGRLVILDPTPFGIRLGLLAGHFDRRYMKNVWSLHETGRRLTECGFAVEFGGRYMMSPVKFPGNERIEAALSGIGLDRFFMQQAILAKLADRT